MSSSFIPTPASIVTCRERQWVVLPTENKEIIRLRPLVSGNEEEIFGIYRPLELESLEESQFPLPHPDFIQDHDAARLLMSATRLSLRNGAGPFRCLGRLSVHPRPYQLVPLLMALRLETIRLLIADDVGVGKTIEAGLIARELLDRGEIKRLAVLCPPHLCDQWQKELQEKFHIEAVVIRSGTAAKLERGLPSGERHIFEYYRHIVVSLDYAKAERRRASFLVHCPDLVIVDEVHTCAISTGHSSSQQQRHQLIKLIAEKPTQNLILLTATPHSGIEQAFLSILGLLKPEFASFDLDSLMESQREQLASHFIQRRRGDVKQWLGDETPFPERDSIEYPYKLSTPYRSLFIEVYNFARGLVKTAEEMTYAQKRGRYWAALALIRCVMSSPAAAIATLNKRESGVGCRETLRADQRSTGVGCRESGEEEVDEELMAAYVYDPMEQEQAVDASPNVVVERQSYKDTERRKLREFIETAKQLQGDQDFKLQKTISTVESILKAQDNPIIWCRYIATAKYVATALRKKLETQGSEIRVIAITGELSEDEREIRLAELTSYPKRVLVATDCLSIGVNLQEHFSAVLHYDLPWNPNRLEQREGRIDRYGQTAEVVKSYLIYGQDNPVDGAVLEVLIRKAVQIHKSLGITVPVPMDSDTVSEAIFKSLFEKIPDARQLSLLDLLENTDLGSEKSALDSVHKSWDKAVEREKISRTRFAQRSIKPEEVRQELVESDQILGTEKDVEEFVIAACERLNCSLKKQKKGWLLPNPPKEFQAILGDKSRLIAFTTPTKEGVEYIGRNHSLVEGLARYLLEEALSNTTIPIAARSGFTVTDAVSQRTVLLLLRLRHLLEGSKGQSLLAEECLVVGFTDSPANPLWLEPEEALELLKKAVPVGDRPLGIKQMEIEDLLNRLDELTTDLELFANTRSQVLTQSHRRVRAITKEGQVKVKPQLPMDVLGVYILFKGMGKRRE